MKGSRQDLSFHKKEMKKKYLISLFCLYLYLNLYKVASNTAYSLTYDGLLVGKEAKNPDTIRFNLSFCEVATGKILIQLYLYMQVLFHLFSILLVFKFTDVCVSMLSIINIAKGQ